MDDWLEDAQEKWWNELTVEEQEEVQADAIMQRKLVEWEDRNTRYESEESLDSYFCIPLFHGKGLEEDEIPW